MKTVAAICLSLLLAASAPGFAENMPYPDFGSIAKTPPASKDRAPVAATTQPPATESAKREAWRATMSRRPAPKNGCFTASYPSTEWQEAPCGRASPHPNQPVVGNGNDFVAKTSGLISSAKGSFLSPTSASGETGTVANTSTAANVFSLQLNTQNPVFSGKDHAPFTTAACNGHPGCSGWQQFIFSQTQGPAPGPGQQSAAPGAPVSTTPGLFIEYWLINYGATCPTLPSWAGPGTWTQQRGTTNCWFNGPMTYVPPLTVADLAPPPPNGSGVVMTATAGVAADWLVLSTASGEAYLYQAPSVLGLSGVWTEAEFNVFGDCCVTRANFTSPTTLNVETSIEDGTFTAPTCVPQDGPTGETNNLTLAPTGAPACCPISGASTAIAFTESTDLSATSLCSCPAGQVWWPSNAACSLPLSLLVYVYIGGYSQEADGLTPGEQGYGVVSMSSPATAGGAQIALSSSDPAGLIVPAGVTISEGQSSSALFSVNDTYRSGPDKYVLITATYGGVSVSFPLVLYTSSKTFPSCTPCGSPERCCFCAGGGWNGKYCE